MCPNRSWILRIRQGLFSYFSHVVIYSVNLADIRLNASGQSVFFPLQCLLSYNFSETLIGNQTPIKTEVCSLFVSSEPMTRFMELINFRCLAFKLSFSESHSKTTLLNTMKQNRWSLMKGVLVAVSASPAWHLQH